MFCHFKAYLSLIILFLASNSFADLEYRIAYGECLRKKKCESALVELRNTQLNSLGDLASYLGIQCDDGNNYFTGNGFVIDRTSCGDSKIAQVLAQATRKSVENLVQCFTVDYPQKFLLRAVERIRVGGKVFCASAPPPLETFEMSTNREENSITVFPRFYSRPEFHTGLTEAIRGITHEILHLADVDNLEREEHNKGGDIRLKDRVYSCERLCSQSLFVTMEECKVCIDFATSSHPKAQRNCNKLISRAALEDFYNTLKSYNNDCGFPKPRKCATKSPEKIQQKIKEILKKFPDDNRNRNLFLEFLQKR